MKITVQYDDIREFEFKPGTTLTEYLQLTQGDVKNRFLSGSPLVDCNCPACDNVKRNEAFSKFGLKYQECSNCKTLYVSPRPDEQAIDDYYRDSNARVFWNQHLLTETEAKRREKLFKPRVQWIIETVEEYFPAARRFTSINSVHSPFLQELIDSDYFKETNIVSPRADLSHVNCEKDGIEVVNDLTSAFSRSTDAVTLFEVIDRLSDVDAFAGALEKLLVPGGLCFLTTISISGFDLQVLWDKSNSIFPPDRMNVLSTEGLMTLFERHGFECIELSTPGLLDVQIVANACKENTSIEIPRFIRYLIDQRSDDTLQTFQEFLQMNQLSSFTRAVFQKK